MKLNVTEEHTMVITYEQAWRKESIHTVLTSDSLSSNLGKT